MDTYFPPPERVEKEKIQKDAAFVCKSALVSELMNTMGGVLVVLNENRQILAVNNEFLKYIGFEDPNGSLGLRPGEVLGCDYSECETGGCGTSRYCSTCGAALAIVSALNNEKPENRICALSCNRKGMHTDMVFLVRAQHLTIEDVKLVLLFLQDITVQQQRAALERTFFHDVRNILSGVLGASELLINTENRERQISLTEMIHGSSLRLNKEVDIQRYLLQSESLNYQPIYDAVLYSELLRELLVCVSSHPEAVDKTISLQEPVADVSLRIDTSLVLRVLTNMLTNALEATDKGGEVKMFMEKDDNNVLFSVWNDKKIPDNIALRVFQRNFSTKKGDGRGIGTFSMKLFGEKVLGGKVAFTSTEEDGTVFSLTLPQNR